MKVGVIDIIFIIFSFQMFILFIFIFFRKAGLLSNYILGIRILSQLMVTSHILALNQWHFLFNYPDFIFMGFPFIFIQAPLIYLHVKSVAYKNFKLKFSHLLHLIPFVIVLAFCLITFFPYSYADKIKILHNPSYLPFSYVLQINILARLLYLPYIIASVLVMLSVKKELRESYSSISMMNLSWLRFLVIGSIIVYILTAPIVIYNSLGNISSIFLLYMMMPSFIYFNIIFFKAWYHPELFSGIEEAVKYKSSKLTKEEAQILLYKLNKYIETNKPFLNPDLSLQQLADELNINHKYLSQIINEYFNQNFFDYINKLRVEESKKMLLDLSCNKAVLEILLEAGFNSKSAYYIAFKKAVGLTPIEFKKRYSKTSVPSGKQ